MKSSGPRFGGSMTQTWREFISSGHSDRHVALFYKRDEFVHRCVAVWVAASLTERGGAILVGRPAKCVGIRTELRRLGVDVDAHEAASRLVVIDAETLMAQFVREGGLDGKTFADLAEGLAARVRAAAGDARAPVRAWGEMVDLLCARQAPERAAELESLWEHVLDRHDFQLLCSYHLDGTGGGVLDGQCASHTQALLEEADTPLESAVARSLSQVFRESVPRDPNLLYASRTVVKVGGERDAVLVALARRAPVRSA